MDVIIDLIEEFEGIPAEELRILNEAPVSMIDLVDVNACMTINEARKDILGLDELDDPERGNRFIREEINMQTVEDNQGTVNAQEDVQGSNNG